MLCGRCQIKTKVIDSRIQGNEVYRRRRCPNCGYTFSTREIEYRTNTRRRFTESNSKVTFQNI